MEAVKWKSISRKFCSYLTTVSVYVLICRLCMEQRMNDNRLNEIRMFNFTGSDLT
jgi:hypothetical protein